MKSEDIRDMDDAELHIDELGDWTLGPAGRPYDTLSGTLTRTEIVDELDTEEGRGVVTENVVDLGGILDG